MTGNFSFPFTGTLSPETTEVLRLAVREFFNFALLQTEPAMKAAIRTRGVRRLDDVEEVFQRISVRLSIYIDQLIPDNLSKWREISTHLAGYLVRAATNEAASWLREQLRDLERNAQSRENEDGDALDPIDGIAASATLDPLVQLLGRELHFQLYSIHAEALARMQSGIGGAIARKLMGLHEDREPGSDSYTVFLWLLGYLFGADRDDEKRALISTAYIARETGLRENNPIDRETVDWLNARTRLDTQACRLRKRAREILLELLDPSSASSAA